MSASILGMILSTIFLLQIILHAISDMRVFNDIPGFILIVGCTVSVALCVYTGKDTMHIFKLMLITFKPHVDTNADTVTEIMTLVKETDGDYKRLEGMLGNIKHPFLKEGVQLVVERFESHHIEEILKERVKKAKEEHAHKTNSVKTLAKYPPAFGIMACVIGLISVMQKLGGALGPGELAPSMAVALVGTLIGLVAANFVIMPMGENLQIKADIDIKDRKIIQAAVLMLARKEAALVIQEKLNSYLSADKRVDVLGIGGGASTRKAS